MPTICLHVVVGLIEAYLVFKYLRKVLLKVTAKKVGMVVEPIDLALYPQIHRKWSQGPAHLAELFVNKLGTLKNLASEKCCIAVYHVHVCLPPVTAPIDKVGDTIVLLHKIYDFGIVVYLDALTFELFEQSLYNFIHSTLYHKVAIVLQLGIG